MKKIRRRWLRSLSVPLIAASLLVSPVVSVTALAQAPGEVAQDDESKGRPLDGYLLMVMLAKIAVDLTFHLWSLRRCAAWTGQPNPAPGLALLAALIEPFSFQLLRHAGAAWGWVTFLSGRQVWSRSARTAVSGVAPIA